MLVGMAHMLVQNFPSEVMWGIGTACIEFEDKY